MDESEIQRLSKIAKQARINIITAIHHVQTGHPGSSLSLIEMLTLLYFRILKYDPENPLWEERDYLLLSKGHGSPGLYGILQLAGFLEKEELLTLRQLGTKLQGHPSASHLPGVDFSTGSLGQGISVASGIAQGLKLRSKNNKVFCICGDGELQEGQNWEAAMAAATFKLDNLVVIVDRNDLQNDGPTEELMKLGNLKEKWKSFNWFAQEVDGHSFVELDHAISNAFNQQGKPSIIIANTVKGKGVSYMEGVVHWHHHPINETDYSKALEDIKSSK